MMEIDYYKVTPAGMLEERLREGIRRASGKHFAFTISKMSLPDLLPSDWEAPRCEIVGRQDEPLPLRIPETSMDKLRKIAQRLGMTVETDSYYCRTRNVILLEKRRSA